MSRPHISEEKANEIVIAFHKHFCNATKAAKDLGLTYTTFISRLRIAKRRGLLSKPNVVESTVVLKPVYRIQQRKSRPDETKHVLAIGDCHDSPRLPDKKRFFAMGRYAKENKVDQVVQIGDFASANSYSPDNYEFDMPVFSGIPLSDFIDARPRVKEYNLSSTTSPFDYDTRDFSVSGNKPPVIVGDDVVTIGYSHYLARVDKLFLSKDGFFELKKGAPAPTADAVPPSDPAGAFSVATIAIQPYARNAKRSSTIKTARHKRYTMADIGRLEKRLKNVEFYTQLSLLETDTASLTITDAKTGLDRFKYGFMCVSKN